MNTTGVTKLTDDQLTKIKDIVAEWISNESHKHEVRYIQHKQWQGLTLQITTIGERECTIANMTDIRKIEDLTGMQLYFVQHKNRTLELVFYGTEEP